MARRKTKRSSRRRFTGWNATNILEGYLQASVLTQMAFNTTPGGFIFGDAGSSYALVGPNKISFKEIMDGLMAGGPTQGHAKTQTEMVWDNLQANWVDGAIRSIGIGIGFKIGKRILSRPRNAANRFIKQLGMGSTVRV